MCTKYHFLEPSFFWNMCKRTKTEAENLFGGTGELLTAMAGTIQKVLNEHSI